VPGGSVATEKNDIVWKLFREFFEEDVHTNGITKGHDQEVGISCKRFYGAINIPVLADMMARDRWPDTSLTPTVFWLVDPPEASFILKHKTDFLSC
jgi:hypothetical protein